MNCPLGVTPPICSFFVSTESSITSFASLDLQLAPRPCECGETVSLCMHAPVANAWRWVRSWYVHIASERNNNINYENSNKRMGNLYDTIHYFIIYACVMIFTTDARRKAMVCGPIVRANAYVR